MSLHTRAMWFTPRSSNSSLRIAPCPATVTSAGRSRPRATIGGPAAGTCGRRHSTLLRRTPLGPASGRASGVRRDGRSGVASWPFSSWERQPAGAADTLTTVRRRLLGVLVVALAALATGCLRVDVAIDVHDDGSGAIHSVQAV